MKKFARFLIVLVSIPTAGAIIAAMSSASIHNSKMEAENSKLKEEIQVLNRTVEGLRNEPQGLFSRAHDQRRNNNFQSARATLTELRSKYPEFRVAEVSAALDGLEPAERIFLAEKAEKERLKLKEQERIDAENARMAAQKRVETEKIEAENAKIAEQKRLEDAKLASEREKELAKIVKNLKKTRDEIKEIDWYRDTETPETNNTKNIHAYIGKSKGQVWLRFRMCYRADSWLFVRSVSFKVDGQTTSLDYSLFNDWERDNANGGIWEWKDVPMDANTWTLVNSIANSKKTIMRYEGRQYQSDREIGATEKKAMKNIIKAFEAMGGVPPKL